MRKAYRGRIFFHWKEEEAIHGLGQAEEGIYNYRGHNQYLYQHNMRIPMPALVSTEGYGILFDCCSLMTFCGEGKQSYLFLDTVDQMEDREKKWNCYLPEGCKWYDYWTNDCYEGGRYVTVDAPIDRIPLFVRAGAIIPTVGGLQYVMQKPGRPMEVYVYSGAAFREWKRWSTKL